MRFPSWFSEFFFNRFGFDKDVVSECLNAFEVLNTHLPKILKQQNQASFLDWKNNISKTRFHEIVDFDQYEKPELYYNFTFLTVRFEIFSRSKNIFSLRIAGYLLPDSFINFHHLEKDYDTDNVISLTSFSSGWRYYGQFYKSDFQKCVKLFCLAVVEFLHEVSSGEVDF